VAGACAPGCRGLNETAEPDDVHAVRELALPRSLDVSVVGAVAVQLIDAVAVAGLILDASAVARIDAAGLQLLCAAVAAARSAGRPVSWKAVSETVIEGARTLGLSPALGLPHGAASGAASELAARGRA
jgi:phospholipid transport system transporter-binding protein